MISRKFLQAITAMILGPVWSGTGQAVPSYTETFETSTYQDAAYTTADWNTAGGELRLFQFEPAVLGSYDTSGNASSVWLGGDLALVTDSTDGLLLFDITDPEMPLLLSAAGFQGNDIAVSGNLVAVSTGAAGIGIVEISNRTLIPRGLFDTPGSAGAVAIAGDLVYVADGLAGLRVIDIVDPDNLAGEGSYDTPGNAHDVVVSGNIALVADYNTVQILNVSNPALPAWTATFNTTGNPVGIAVAGDLAVAATGAAGIEIFDITDPSLPMPVSILDTPGYAWRVEIDGNNVYVADSAGGMQIVDIRWPDSPQLVATLDTPGSVRDVKVAGTMAVVADNTSGFATAEIATWPAVFATGAGCALSGTYANEIAVAGDLITVALDGIGLETLDITGGMHTDPVPRDLFPTASYSSAAVALAGDRAYLADGFSGFTIVDISDPDDLALVQNISTSSMMLDVAVAGDLAFVTERDEGLQIFDIGPNGAAQIGTVPATGSNWVFQVAVAGDVAYIGWNEPYPGLLSFQAVDISQPAAPVPANTLTFAENGATEIVLRGDYAFLSYRQYPGGPPGGVKIIDISSPFAPALIATYEIAGDVWDLDAAGDYLLLATSVGLEIVDIHDPFNPVSAGNLMPTSYSTLAVSGDMVYATLPVLGYLSVFPLFQNIAKPAIGVGQSLPVDGGDGTLQRVRISTSASSVIPTWEISANGGADWQTITPGGQWSLLAVPGNDLVWRATFGIVGNGPMPIIREVRLDWLLDGPFIDAISDVPGDQGKQVRLTWTRSGHDFVGDAAQIFQYAIYREIDGASPVEQTGAAPDKPGSPPLAPALAGWDFVGVVPATAEDEYAMVVPTLADSTEADGQHLSRFMVRALTATPGVFFDSEPATGYSVDNLAPSVPTNLVLAYFTGSGNTLSWDESPDVDFRYFNVYRASDSDFVPAADNLVHSTTTTNWVDPDHDGTGVFYLVSAVDFAGNESAAAEPGVVSDVPDSELPLRAALHQNAPNPFNPRTTISYDLPAADHVRLLVFDMAGRLVCTLVDGERAAGRQEARWDGRDNAGRAVAAGVYFCHLEAGSYRETRRMMLVK